MLYTSTPGTVMMDSKHSNVHQKKIAHINEHLYENHLFHISSFFEIEFASVPVPGSKSFSEVA